MKQILILFILTFLSMTLLGQKQKLPPKGRYYSISKTQCEFPKQTGKLEIIRNDSIKMTIYRTDDSEMFMYADHFIGFISDWDQKDEAQKIFFQLDSLVTLLFQNGLMTSDLLVQAFNVENKFINHKGDTIDFTNHVQTKVVKLLNIKRKDFSPNYFPKNFKGKKKFLLFEIWATFDIYESGWGSFPVFDLYLESEIEVTESNLTEYLEKAEIKCLLYIGIQI